MRKHFMKFLDEIITPKIDILKFIIEYWYSSALKRSSHRLNILALLTGER